MLRSMYSAISGMQAFQTDLDVVGNNIANVNTIGFKAGRAEFADLLSQTESGGNAPNSQTGEGGVNPTQVGLGVKTEAIQNLMTQGADQSTGNPLDVAINGQGFFIVSPDTPTASTTVGTQLYTRAGDFNLDSNDNLVLPDGNVAVGYDTTTPNPNMRTVNLKNLLTTYNTVNATAYTLPSQPDVQIGSDGSINTTVLNPATNQTQQVTLGHLALATFPNPNGLEKVGDSLFQSTTAAGPMAATQPGQKGAGSLMSGALEMSNVDLTQEFSEMIVAQNGFVANSHMIGTDNQVLQALVSMKNS